MRQQQQQQHYYERALSIFPNGLLRRHCRLLLITRWRISDRVFDAPSTVRLESTTEVLRRFRWFPPKIQWWIADFALNSLQLRKRQSIGRLGGIHNKAQQCLHFQNTTSRLVQPGFKEPCCTLLWPEPSGLKSVVSSFAECIALSFDYTQVRLLRIFVLIWPALCFVLIWEEEKAVHKKTAAASAAAGTLQ